MPYDQKQALAEYLMKKSAGGGSINDPVARYVRDLPRGEPAPAARDGAREAMMRARERRRQEEIERMQRINEALVYSDILGKPSPNIIKAADLGIKGDRSRGILYGLDPSQLKPGDLEWLQAYSARQMQAKK